MNNQVIANGIETINFWMSQGKTKAQAKNIWLNETIAGPALIAQVMKEV